MSIAVRPNLTMEDSEKFFNIFRALKIRLHLLSTCTLFKCCLQNYININTGIKKQSLTNKNFVLVFVLPNSAREEHKFD